MTAHSDGVFVSCDWLCSLFTALPWISNCSAYLSAAFRGVIFQTWAEQWLMSTLFPTQGLAVLESTTPRPYLFISYNKSGEVSFSTRIVGWWLNAAHTHAPPVHRAHKAECYVTGLHTVSVCTFVWAGNGKCHNAQAQLGLVVNKVWRNFSFCTDSKWGKSHRI